MLHGTKEAVFRVCTCYEIESVQFGFSQDCSWIPGGFCGVGCMLWVRCVGWPLATG